MKDGEDQIGHTAQSIKPNLNDQPIQVQFEPEKVSGVQNKPRLVKQNLNRNLHKSPNRNLNRQHHQAIHQHELGHTMQMRRTLKPNLGHSRPTSGDYTGLHQMSGDYTVNRNPFGTFTHQPVKAARRPGAAKHSRDYRVAHVQPNRNFNERNQDYAIGSFK